MYSWFVRFWKSEDSEQEILNSEVDLVVATSYAMAAKNRLAIATRLNLEKALGFLEIFPDATLAFGNWPLAFPGSEKVESQLKHALFPELSYKKAQESVIKNSVDEAEQIREITTSQELEPKCILVVTGELHSRSERFILQSVFPNAKILVSCIGYENEVEKDNIIIMQRTLLRWIYVTLGRHLLLRTVGLRIRNLTHKVE